MRRQSSRCQTKNDFVDVESEHIPAWKRKLNIHRINEIGSRIFNCVKYHLLLKLLRLYTYLWMNFLTSPKVTKWPKGRGISIQYIISHKSVKGLQRGKEREHSNHDNKYLITGVVLVLFYINCKLVLYEDCVVCFITFMLLFTFRNFDSHQYPLFQHVLLKYHVARPWFICTMPM